MGDRSSALPDWSIESIVRIAGKVSGRHLDIRPTQVKLIDSWHLLKGFKWENSSAVPAITYPSQLLPLMVCKLFITVEDVDPERFYSFGDFHQTICVDRNGKVGVDSKNALLDALAPQEYKEKDAKELGQRVDELIDTMIVLINLTRNNRG